MILNVEIRIISTLWDFQIKDKTEDKNDTFFLIVETLMEEVEQRLSENNEFDFRDMPELAALFAVFALPRFRRKEKFQIISKRIVFFN